MHQELEKDRRYQGIRTVNPVLRQTPRCPLVNYTAQLNLSFGLSKIDLGFCPSHKY